MPSLRRRLLAAFAVVVVVMGCAGIVQLYFDSRHNLEHLFDTQLSQTAHLTLALVVNNAEARPGRATTSLRPRIVRAVHALRQQYHRELAFQLISASGRVLARSPAAPNHPFTRTHEGFSDVVVGSIRWRVYAVSTPDNVWTIQIADETRQRKTVEADFGTHLLWFLPLYLIPFILLTWFGVHRALKPLNEISRLIARRDAHDLTPIDKRKAPREIGPLVDALNGLFAKLDTAMQREREFVAHAAHELRTPLAALKSQAETALAAAERAVRERALQQIIAGVDRAGHLIEQLLALAKLDSTTFRIRLRPLDLHALCQGVLAEIAPAALAKNIDLALEESPNPVRVSGERDALALLVRNLVDNAIRYTPVGGAVEVAVQSTAGEVTLEVRDSGPGIAPEGRERAFQRFWRAAGSRTVGSGLGLSIVKRIANVHHATAEFADPVYGQHGARIIVRFPRPPETEAS